MIGPRKLWLMGSTLLRFHMGFHFQDLAVREGGLGLGPVRQGVVEVVHATNFVSWIWIHPHFIYFEWFISISCTCYHWSFELHSTHFKVVRNKPFT